MFDNEDWCRLIPKLPYSFSYLFEDDEGRKSELQILDWEIGALFWKCQRRSGESGAIEKVKKKYFEEFCQKDLHFFLGTTYQFHSIAPNPWVIIGVFPIPHQIQLELI